ncbi:carotenoid biosynthesis protein, partial [Escherichia coli]|nr:carotenoid biosynthesis protein [Escherichia coli]
GAVSLNFWQYHEGGFFYGVPLSNFAGWLFSASAGAAILEIFIYFFRPLLPVPMQMAISSLFIVYFWTWINLWNGIYMPVLIGCLIA